MNSDLIPGFEFIAKRKLSKREVLILSPFLERDYTSAALSLKLSIPKPTIYHLIQRLVDKGVLRMVDKDKFGAVTFRFCREPREDI